MNHTWTQKMSLCSSAIVALFILSSQFAGAGTRDASTVEQTEARVTSSDGLSLFLREYGTGDTPIVLLTGGPGYSGDYLEEMAVRFATQHRVILPDQRGTGRSVINPWDASRHTIEACVADVEAVRAYSGAEEVIVVGHSWGGILALAYAANHGEHIRALVLIGSGGATSNWNTRYSQNVIAALSSDDMAAVFQAQGLMATDPDKAIVDMIRATAPSMILDRELAFRSADAYSGPSMLTPAVTLAMQGWLQDYDISDGLDAVDAAVLVVQGTRDPVGQETAQEIAAIFSNSELHFIEESAHEPYMEQPEAFYGIVEPFLREHSGEPE